jgi:hypothetical protein
MSQVLPWGSVSDQPTIRGVYERRSATQPFLPNNPIGAWAARPARGQRCLIQTIGGETTYKGSVRFIDPVVNSALGATLVRVGIELPANDDRLRPGSAVNVQFLAKD